MDLSYNLNRYTQYKHVWKLFEVSCLHQHTAIALHRLNINQKLIEIFVYAGNNRVMRFTDRNWSLKPCIEEFPTSIFIFILSYPWKKRLNHLPLFILFSSLFGEI